MSTANYQYQSEFARKYFFEGKAEGKAEAVLAVLSARGLEVPDEVRTRLLATTDLTALDDLLRAAVTAPNALGLLRSS